VKYSFQWVKTTLSVVDSCHYFEKYIFKNYDTFRPSLCRTQQFECKKKTICFIELSALHLNLVDSRAIPSPVNYGLKEISCDFESDSSALSCTEFVRHSLSDHSIFNFFSDTSEQLY
jgi:hypothetical protein